MMTELNNEWLSSEDIHIVDITLDIFLTKLRMQSKLHQHLHFNAFRMNLLNFIV